MTFFSAFLGCCDREFNRSDISDDEAVREYSVVVSEEIWEDDDDDARLTEDVSFDNVAEPEVEENRTVAPAPVYDNLPVSFKLDKVLEDLSDSEDEDSAVIEKSENLDQNETMIETNELSPVSSPLSLQDKNGNTTKKDEIDMSMWDPYENSSIGYFLVAHYIACSRWAKINGLDLNFTGFVMSGTANRRIELFSKFITFDFAIYIWRYATSKVILLDLVLTLLTHFRILKELYSIYTKLQTSQRERRKPKPAAHLN